MKELIRLIDVSTNTDNFADLNHLFLTIFCGQVHYLAGLHGSGKSALRNVLCGQLPATAGTLAIDGTPVLAYTPQDAWTKGIFSIEQNASPMIPSLSIYENMELFYSAQKSKRSFRLFDRRNAYKRTQALFEEYGLSIDSSTKVQDITTEDAFLLYLLEAVYVNARLVILNLSNLKLSYMNNQKLFHILKQMNSQGTALLLICDSFSDQSLLPGKINIIRKGRIIKQYDSPAVDAAHINNILIPAEMTASPKNIVPSSGSITGIMELYYSNYSLPNYFANLGILSGDSPDSSIKFLKTDSLECFCSNLSIGDNIALVRYPSIAEKTGYIDKALLRYLEEEFNKVLSGFGAPLAKNMEDLSIAGKKILGIERWVMAGVRKFVIEDPLFGLDAKGQQILLRYFISLRNRNIRLIFVFYNLSELQKICDIVHICSHGKIL